MLSNRKEKQATRARIVIDSDELVVSDRLKNEKKPSLNTCNPSLENILLDSTAHLEP